MSKTFLRRNYIYFVEENGDIQKLNINDCKLSNPLRRVTLVDVPLIEAMFSDLSIHLEFYSDYLIANTALMISHGKILSIYDFKTKMWDHVVPKEQGDANALIEEEAY